jgi:hypothetical protein
MTNGSVGPHKRYKFLHIMVFLAGHQRTKQILTSVDVEPIHEFPFKRTMCEYQTRKVERNRHLPG